jgi:hypothetical protein
MNKNLKEAQADAAMSLTLIPHEVISAAQSKEQPAPTSSEKQSKSKSQPSTKTKETPST